MIRPPNFEALTYWMQERHAIYLKRLLTRDPKEWTTDPIFRQYSFCNVFRELDRVTMWIDANMRKPFADHPNLWFLMCLARQINWPPTLNALLIRTDLPDEWNPTLARDVLLDLQAQKKKVYTGAYMLRGDIQNPDSTMPNDKPTYTCFKVLDPVFKNATSTDFLDTEAYGSIEEWTNYLESFHGWGGFLAYEVATDLTHTRYLRYAFDKRTWANPGPGAKRGLNRLYGRPLNQSVSRQQAIEEMCYLLELCEDELPAWVHPGATGFCSTLSPGLELRDIEHSLCETDKYLRVKQGEGRPRAKFKPWNGKW